MLAQDGGNPPRTRAAILTVNMLRNLRTPTFGNGTFQATILETQAIGRPILRVRARDADRKPPHNRVTYELQNEYFTIDDEGRISLKRSLLEDGTEEYRVSNSQLVHVCLELDPRFFGWGSRRTCLLFFEAVLCVVESTL